MDGVSGKVWQYRTKEMASYRLLATPLNRPSFYKADLALLTRRSLVHIKVGYSYLFPLSIQAGTVCVSCYRAEYKAEVALLTRRILFTSDSTSPTTAKGPHTTIESPNARVVGAAYERWGSRNFAGMYPIHFHLAGETTNAYIKNNAVYK